MLFAFVLQLHPSARRSTIPRWPRATWSPNRSGAYMSFKFDQIHLWSGEVADTAGGVAAKLAFLAQAGANLEYVYTKRLPDKPGAGILYVAPVTGPTQVRAARSAGLAEAHDPIV